MFQQESQPPQFHWVNGSLDEAVDVLAEKYVEGRLRRQMEKSAQGESMLSDEVKQQLWDAAKWGLGGAGIGGALGLGSEMLSRRKKRRPLSAMLTGGLLGGAGGAGFRLAWQNFPWLSQAFGEEKTKVPDAIRKAEEKARTAQLAAPGDTTAALQNLSRRTGLPAYVFPEYKGRIERYGEEKGLASLFKEQKRQYEMPGGVGNVMMFRPTTPLPPKIPDVPTEYFARTFGQTPDIKLPAGQKFLTPERFRTAMADQAAQEALLKEVAGGGYVKGVTEGGKTQLVPLTAAELKNEKVWEALKSYAERKGLYSIYQPQHEKELRKALAETIKKYDLTPTEAMYTSAGEASTWDKYLRLIGMGPRATGGMMGGPTWGEAFRAITGEGLRATGGMMGGLPRDGGFRAIIGAGSPAPSGMMGGLPDLTPKQIDDLEKVMLDKKYGLDPLDIISAESRGKNRMNQYMRQVAGAKIPYPGKPGGEEPWTVEELEKKMPDIFEEMNKAVPGLNLTWTPSSRLGGLIQDGKILGFVPPSTLAALGGGFGAVRVMDLVGRMRAQHIASGEQLWDALKGGKLPQDLQDFVAYVEKKHKLRGLQEIMTPGKAGRNAISKYHQEYLQSVTNVQQHDIAAIAAKVKANLIKSLPKDGKNVPSIREAMRKTKPENLLTGWGQHSRIFLENMRADLAGSKVPRLEAMANMPDAELTAHLANALTGKAVSLPPQAVLGAGATTLPRRVDLATIARREKAPVRPGWFGDRQRGFMGYHAPRGVRPLAYGAGIALPLFLSGLYQSRYGELPASQRDILRGMPNR